MLTCMMVGASGYVSPRTPTARLSSGWWRPSPPRHSNEVEVWLPEVVTAVSMCQQKLIKFRICRNCSSQEKYLNLSVAGALGGGFRPTPAGLAIQGVISQPHQEYAWAGVSRGSASNSAAGCRAGVWWKVSSSEIRLHHLLRWSLVAEYL